MGSPVGCLAKGDYQKGEGGGRNILFQLTHPRLGESLTSEDIPEKTPVNRVIGLSEVHLSHKIGGVISTTCCYDLFRQHDTVFYLLAHNKGRL